MLLETALYVLLWTRFLITTVFTHRKIRKSSWKPRSRLLLSIRLGSRPNYWNYWNFEVAKDWTVYGKFMRAVHIICYHSDRYWFYTVDNTYIILSFEICINPCEYLQKLSGVVENGERIIKTADNCAKLMLDNSVVFDGGEEEEEKDEEVHTVQRCTNYWRC